jgi:tetratricopeptide (TPR) repeat protein
LTAAPRALTFAVMTRTGWTLASFLILAPLALAEEDPHAACGNGTAGWVPREVLERPVPLRRDIGNAHEAVTTAQPEAQRYYDQGLDYLHGYVWIEAARSFHEALRRDPALALAHLGLSRVYSGLDDPKAARAAWERAQALEDKASARERRLIALRGTQLDAIEHLDDPARHAAYKRAIDAALAADIGEVQLWLLRGNAEEPTAAGRGQRGNAASTAFYRTAMQLQPDNAAAHHYLTHSYETIGQIPLALEHGEAYARLAKAIPHAHHMWGHDLRRVGRIDDAIAAFRRTDELERQYYAAEGIDPALDWHHIHNLDLLATAYQYKGQMRRAEQTMREADALGALTEYQEVNRRALTLFLLGRGRWQDALTAIRPLREGRYPAARVVGHSLAGHALLALGRTDEARAALAAAQKDLESVPKLAAGLFVTRTSATPWVDALRGELALRSGARDEGRRVLQAVQTTLRALPGPDAWIQALFRLELIARAARDVGDWELADHTARQMLEHDPAYAGAHLAAALVSVQAGRTEQAERAFAEARRFWQDADADLPERKQIEPPSVAFR